MLEGKGFSVEAVHDGETGAEYAETGIYDLLILDRNDARHGRLSGRAAGAREALRDADFDADSKVVA